MDKPRISVALCTYNGERFLKEQLESLAQQLLLPTELIVCDDASTDKTLEIINEFTKNAPFEVKLYQNKVPLQVTKNFEKAFSLCTGDILFPCDQDDVWLPNKIARLTKELLQRPDLQLVFSNALLVDENRNSLHKTQFEVVRFWEKQQKQWKNKQAIDVMLGGNRVTGCTLAFRKILLQNALPFPTHLPKVMHDNWLAWTATLRNSIDFIEDILTEYRQHEQQQVGSTKAKKAPASIAWKERFGRPRHEKLAPFQAQLQEWQPLIEALQENQEIPNLLLQKLLFLQMRTQLSSNHLKRIVPVFSHIIQGSYHRFQDQEASNHAPYLAILGDLLE